jgi:GNAT superfamily N-acetyltransferase
MTSKVVIRDLSASRLDRINIKCVRCSFWFDYRSGSFLDDIIDIKSFNDFKNFLSKRLTGNSYPEDNFVKLVDFSGNGGIVKGAFKGKKCIGILTAGDPELFPKLQSFTVFPPDPESTFLGCIYVEPEMRGLGVKKRLLIELEKDLLKKNVKAIETIGKRLDDDIGEEEFENSPLLSFKFLINNGFYLKKNDEHHPLLRLDLKSIARGFSREEISLEKLAYKKAVRQPVVIREK